MKLTFVALIGLVHLGACAGVRRQTHVTTYPDHTVRWQVETTNGVPDGLSRTWHENGRLASRGNYRHGVRDGVWLYWDQAGTEVARYTYRDGRLVARAEADGFSTPARAQGAAAAESTPGPAGRSAPGLAASGSDIYTVLGVSAGVGQTNATERVDSDGSQGAPVMALVVQLRHRHEMWVYGGSADLSGELFGASHSHLGGVVGLASPGDRAHVELLGEGGMHLVSGLGEDLFTTTTSNGSATLPYVGGQLRLDMDPGAPGHIRMDVAVAGRVDLGRTERQVMTRTCLFGCSDDIETWKVGGQTFDVTLGLTYQFE